MHQIWIARKTFGRGNVLDPMLRPKSTFVTKRA
jgi:hypothetical protein